LKKSNYASSVSCLACLFLASALLLPGCGSSSGAIDNPTGPDTTASAPNSGGLLSKLGIVSAKPVTVPAGTEVHVILDSTISTRDSQSGDTFEATVSEPVVVGGETIIPRDSRVKGLVVEARSSGRLSKPAYLSVALNSIDANGSWVDVNSRPITLEGKSHKKRDAVAIGGGSVLGALIGGIAGGGKGAAIGAAAGAGAGTAGAAATGKQEISLPAESHLTFRLSESVRVKVG
jgi:hypothetical protein